MVEHKYPNLTLTFLLENKGKILIVKRLSDEKHFPGFWAFPGGRVKLGETIVDTLIRKIKEKTRLEIAGEFVLLDVYAFRQSTAVAFLLKAKSQKVIPAGFEQYKWVSTLSDLKYLKRIPGIDNHLVAAKKALKKNIWTKLEDVQLSVDKYLNY